MSDASADEYYVESNVVREFIAHVHDTVAATTDRADTVRLLRPAFDRLLHDQQWLPPAFQTPDTSGGMGGGIGNYLIYRSAGRDLTLMSLVVPPGASTPVHDHLAWGLVGLYAGEQEETVYRRVDSDPAGGNVHLEEAERRRLEAGDFYDLLPPEGDIHGVHTISSGPSVSIHLLGNDIGCVWRHRYHLDTDHALPFRSSYSNVPCEPGETEE